MTGIHVSISKSKAQANLAQRTHRSMVGFVEVSVNISTRPNSMPSPISSSGWSVSWRCFSPDLNMASTRPGEPSAVSPWTCPLTMHSIPRIPFHAFHSIQSVSRLSIQSFSHRAIRSIIRNRLLRAIQTAVVIFVLFFTKFIKLSQRNTNTINRARRLLKKQKKHQHPL
jgi:hypothetical protein